MSSDFVAKSNPQLDDAVNSANSPQELREIMLQTLAAQGRIVRTRDDEFDIRVIHRSEPNSPSPVSGYKYEKEVRFAESTGKRTLVIRANTMEDLIALERQVTGG